jgi:S1/P1 Nuclease
MNTSVMAQARKVSRPLARDVNLRTAFKELRMTNQIGTVARGIAALGALLSLCSVSTPARAWGDEGHEVIALIADHYLDPAVRTKVASILVGDKTHLTPDTQMDTEATWADKFRDSDRNTTKVHYNKTHNWHYVDLELSGPDLKSACFGQPSLQGHIASNGPSDDCIVDKINEFTAELNKPKTSKKERLAALQFILHFVGDIHQPLHASDDNDQGGNLKFVTAENMGSGKLHGFWDTQFVTRQAPSKEALANQLIAQITDAQRAQWSAGTAADWANESFAIAKAHSYGLLPAPTSPSHYTLPATYVADATTVVAEQLSKAGVRLAFVLNNALQ